MAIESLEGMLDFNRGLDLLVLEVLVEIKQLGALVTAELFEALKEELTLQITAFDLPLA
jgi:hypothetical protein